MFRIGDSVRFQWNDETVRGKVRWINSDDLFSVRVSVETNAPLWNADEEASFTVDGRFYAGDEPILKLEATLSSVETPFTVVDLDGNRMCRINGSWVLHDGYALDYDAYEALKYHSVEVLFRPEEKA